MIRSLALAWLSMVLIACSGTHVREEVRKSVPASAAPSIRIDNAVGEIRITGSQSHSVDIDAVKSGGSLDDVRNIDVDVESRGNTITLATKYHGFARGGVSYTISVPAGASLDITNSTGAVRIEGIDGDVTAATQTGEVVASLGRVTARRSIDLTATTGSLKLTIDQNSDARVEARTTVGDVRSDFPSLESVRQNVVGARAAGTIGSGTATIRLTATTGAIALRKS